MKPNRPDQRLQEEDAKETEPSIHEPRPGASNSIKKKRPPSGSGTGRKVARKTAHSLIERRRRSKMNEEFGVLKDMIPACAGQEMHKLAILQASIDYMRYLEDCLAEVRAQKQKSYSASPSDHATRPQSATTTRSSSQGVPREEEDNEVSRSQPWPKTLCESTCELISPAISAVGAPAFTGARFGPFHRGESDVQADTSSSATTRFLMRLVQQNSNVSNPRASAQRAFTPQIATGTAASPSGQSMQVSPALPPQSSHSSAPSELDQEASAALLMLNASDRRTSGSSRHADSRVQQSISNFRAISVKDLLSG
ncbi:MAG: hypothetical protein Q9159_007073 [Coniocarpon cinnabarinum]